MATSESADPGRTSREHTLDLLDKARRGWLTGSPAHGQPHWERLQQNHTSSFHLLRPVLALEPQLHTASNGKHTDGGRALGENKQKLAILSFIW